MSILVGYAETPVRIEPTQWTPSPDECLLCAVRLTPGTAGNVADCDFHDQTCDRCDHDLDHPSGRAA